MILLIQMCQKILIKKEKEKKNQYRNNVPSFAKCLCSAKQHSSTCLEVSFTKAVWRLPRVFYVDYVDIKLDKCDL